MPDNVIYGLHVPGADLQKFATVAPNLTYAGIGFVHQVKQVDADAMLAIYRTGRSNNSTQFGVFEHVAVIFGPRLFFGTGIFCARSRTTQARTETERGINAAPP